MATLDRLLRRSSARSYLPFSQPRWRGSFPFPRPQRDLFRITNSSPSALPLMHPKLFGASRPQLFTYEDRRQWHPLGANRPARSLVESYPKMGEKRPLRYVPFDPEPFDPRTGEIYKDLPTGVTMPWRPGVLDQFRIDPWKYGFDNPWKVIICLKRKMRKEVLHALGVAGGTGFKKKKYNQFSYVRCF